MTEMTENVNVQGFAGTTHLVRNSNGEDVEVNAGDVFRMNNWAAFPDVVVLGIDAKGNCWVARPYVYATNVGTTGPVALQGMEQFEIPASLLADPVFTRVGNGRVL